MKNVGSRFPPPSLFSCFLSLSPSFARRTFRSLLLLNYYLIALSDLNLAVARPSIVHGLDGRREREGDERGRDLLPRLRWAFAAVERRGREQEADSSR